MSRNIPHSFHTGFVPKVDLRSPEKIFDFGNIKVIWSVPSEGVDFANISGKTICMLSKYY